ncbi:MAG: F390 synthetase-related protein [candidate division WOR-3 bacterium]
MDFFKFKVFFADFETQNFLVFYLFSKYTFKHFSKRDIENYQRIKRNLVVEYAFRKSEFFNKLYSGYDLKDFKKLPIINKKIMMDNLTAYNTLGLKKEEIINFCCEVEKSRDFSRRFKGLNIGMSSGTSGNKGVEIVTPREEMYMKAAFLARFDFPENQKMRIAFILRVSAPAFNFNILGHSFSYISQLDSIENICRKLENINPNIISAPPSMLKLIAKHVKNGLYKIKPKRVISYAEILYPDVKIFLKEVFNCPIHEIYKATEGPIGITCEKENLHINEDLVYVETLNKDFSETPAGQQCEKLIITDLHKRAQPIIRYNLNDVITISPKRCSCGSNFRVIESIVGRNDHLFYGEKSDREGLQFISPDYISRAIITSSEKIEEYQVFQKNPKKLFIKIELKENEKDESFEKENLVISIKKVFKDYGCKEPEIEISFENISENRNSNKFIRMVREFEVKEDL